MKLRHFIRIIVVLTSLLLIVSSADAQMSPYQGLDRKNPDLKNTKQLNNPAEVTVLWAKRALQGFNLRIWLSNQMVSGLQAWDCGWGDCIPAYPSLGAEFPRSTAIEHLYGAAPLIGANIDGRVLVAEGYNGYTSKKELLPSRNDTLRDRIWVTSVDSLSHPNKKGIDDDGDGLIDEDELDGNDNDGDWDPLTDDLGTDGIPDPYELGCKGSYDSITNPDPACDNYDPFAYDSCRINPDSTHPLKNDRNRYTENNGIPNHGEPNVDEDYAAWSDRDLYCTVTDSISDPVFPAHIPMGVQVNQKSFAWKTSVDSEAFIIIEYDIRNIGRDDWQESSVGFFADMDVGSVYASRFWEHNYVAYDPSTRTAYTHNIVDWGSTPLGITFLGTSISLDSVRFVFRWYDFTTHLGPGQIDSVIYEWMKCDSGAACIDSNQSPTEPSDPKVYIGISGLTIHQGEVIKLYYAMVSGYTIEGMLENARLAQDVYDSVTTLGIEDKRSVLPKSITLNQNYPNPFNPSTQITYSLPRAADVTLKIYDLLGQEVAILVNERKPAGEYTLNWNAVGIPTGVYFYRIVAGEYIETKKMVLIR